MSITPPPPLDPSDPRAGDPTKIVTWITIGGVIITIIVIGSINQWNRGPGGPARPPVVATGTSVAPGATTTQARPTGVYKIIFEGTAKGHYDVPNRGQTFRSADATATWHLEYTYGDGHNMLPDLATAIVTGSGDSQNWRTDVLPNCRSANPQYIPSVSVLKQPGAANTFEVHSPFKGDLVDAKGTCLSYTKAWFASCGPGTVGCPDLDAFWRATFTIEPGQKGTVVTPISKKPLDFINNQPVLGGDHATDSWSATITVIAQ